MNETTPFPPTLDFKDRRAGLIGFGIFVIIIGCVCALFVPLLLLSATMSPKSTGQAADYSAIVSIALGYASLAAAFISLGIGSTMCRRWARALLLIVSWAWMLMGVLGIAALMYVMPRILAQTQSSQHSLPEGTRLFIMLGLLGFLCVAFVIAPGLMVLFYRSRHVKATCEARDPVTRWTDNRPLPVLALSMLLGFGVLWMLPTVLIYHGVTPFFGRFVSGAPGITLMLALMALYCYCAWAIYNLKPAGWWTIVITTAVLLISTIVTYTQADLTEMYRLMGYPEHMIERMQRFNVFGGHKMVWISLIGSLPYFGFLLYVKRYFRQPS